VPTSFQFGFGGSLPRIANQGGLDIPQGRQTNGGEGDPDQFIRFYFQPGTGPAPTPLNPANPDGFLKLVQIQPEGAKRILRGIQNDIQKSFKLLEEQPKPICVTGYAIVGAALGGVLGLASTSQPLSALAKENPAAAFWATMTAALAGSVVGWQYGMKYCQ
jgi:hypothetical protein